MTTCVCLRKTTTLTAHTTKLTPPALALSLRCAQQWEQCDRSHAAQTADEAVYHRDGPSDACLQMASKLTNMRYCNVTTRPVTHHECHTGCVLK